LNEFLSALLSTQGFVLGTLVPFLFVLTVVVFVHEMGHYLVGRWCGIGVRAFSIGFGPELIGFNDRRGTRWKLCAIPLGGYVKFVGDMNATSSQPGEEELDKLSDSERSIAFHTQPVWKRAATVFCRSSVNFLLTIAVFAVLFMTFGRSVLEPAVAEVRPGSPAAEAGILPGDRFVSVDGTKVESFADVQRLVSGRAGDAITFIMLRDGKDVSVVATPQLSEQEDALGNKVKIAVIGVTTNKEVGQPRHITYSPGGAVVAAVEATGQIIERTGLFMKRFVVAVRTNVSSAGRSR
jgi:regulator of sigma E protease